MVILKFKCTWDLFLHSKRFIKVLIFFYLLPQRNSGNKFFSVSLLRCLLQNCFLNMTVSVVVIGNIVSGLFCP